MPVPAPRSDVLGAGEGRGYETGGDGSPARGRGAAGLRGPCGTGRDGPGGSLARGMRRNPEPVRRGAVPGAAGQRPAPGAEVPAGSREESRSPPPGSAAP